MIISALPVGRPCKRGLTAHVTLSYNPSGVPDSALHTLRSWAQTTQPFVAKVIGEAAFGDNRVPCWLLESEELLHLRSLVAQYDESEYPGWWPHMAFSYQPGGKFAGKRNRFHFDRVGVLDGDTVLHEYPLGEVETLAEAHPEMVEYAMEEERTCLVAAMRAKQNLSIQQV